MAGARQALSEARPHARGGSAAHRRPPTAGGGFEVARKGDRDGRTPLADAFVRRSACFVFVAVVVCSKTYSTSHCACAINDPDRGRNRPTRESQTHT
eukprot:7147362-Prymnesium_polylepis.1